MKFKTETQESVTVIALEGNLLGGPDASALVRQLNELIDAGKTRVVLDLATVAFMNSSGLGLLINGFTTMKNAGGSLKIANASEKIVELFKITRLASLIENYPSVHAAVSSFGT